MLTWLYIISFYIVSAFISLLVVNKQWLSLLLISEVLLVLIFLLLLSAACFYNIYVLIFFSFFVLILGGLELALSLLLLLI